MSLNNIATLRPGLLVSLKTSVKGNVKYDKRDIAHKSTVDGKDVAEWETKRTIADPIEFKAAAEARSKAGSIIRSVCVTSNFGLLCPEKDKDELDKALVEARKVVDAFNATATITHVSVYAMIGRVASDDVEAVRSINSEISDLLGKMEAGLKNLDVKSIRQAASDAKEVGQMLTPEAAARVQIAIDTARSAARKIVKAGEQAAQEIDTRAIRKVTEARTAFLDLDEAGTVAAPKQEARALDFAPEVEVKKTKAKARALEL